MPATNPLANVECQDLAEELADRMDMTGEERTKFIHRCMTRSGFKAIPNYVKDDDNSDDDDLGLITRSRSTNKTRNKSSDDNWFNQ